MFQHLSELWNSWTACDQAVYWVSLIGFPTFCFFTSPIILISTDDLENMNAVAERTEIHKLVNSIWNKRKLPEGWRESIIIPIYKKGEKTDCSNYRDISLLLTKYKILSNILL